MPCTKIEDLPENFRGIVATGEDELDEEPEGPRGSFQLNTTYEVEADDRLGKRLKRKAQREIAQMEERAAEEEWVEETANAAELPPEVAESLQEEHERHVSQQVAQMRVDSRLADAVSDAEAEARAVPTLYVKRGSRHYQLATKAKLKPSEPVYQRTPDGKLEYVGEVNGDLELPDTPVTI